MLNCYTYKLLNKDLSHLNDEQLKNHYFGNGLKENRLSNLSFDYERYKKDYPDLQNLTNDQLIWHYQFDGQNERRKAYHIKDKDMKKFKTLCIFTRTDLWENNYISELIGNNNISLFYNGIENIDVNFIKHNNFKNIVLIVCSHPDKIDNYNNIINIINNINPKILINISDEKGNNPKFDTFYNKVPLYFRCYAHYLTNKNYKKLPYINYLPLGYVNDTNININENNLKNINERKYNWGFIGGTKHGNREIMINYFKKIDNYLLLENTPRYNVGNTYKNCIFVPNSYGHINLTCFRLFESSACGAIPVLAKCDKKMLNELLESMENPPWLIFDNWENAIIECNRLLKNKYELQQIQTKIITWWKNIINKKKDIINKILI